MRGDQVIVRAFGDKAFVKRVWTVGAGRVFVTDDAIFEKLLKEETDLMAVGFPVADVFKYDPEIMQGTETNPDWSKLKQYN